MSVSGPSYEFLCIASYIDFCNDEQGSRTAILSANLVDLFPFKNIVKELIHLGEINIMPIVFII